MESPSGAGAAAPWAGQLLSPALNVEVLNAEGVAIDMKDEDDDPSTSSDDLGFNIGARPDAAAKEDQVAEEPEFQ